MAMSPPLSIGRSIDCASPVVTRRKIVVEPLIRTDKSFAGRANDNLPLGTASNGNVNVPVEPDNRAGIENAKSTTCRPGVETATFRQSPLAIRAAVLPSSFASRAATLPSGNSTRSCPSTKLLTAKRAVTSIDDSSGVFSLAMTFAEYSASTTPPA